MHPLVVHAVVVLLPLGSLGLLALLIWRKARPVGLPLTVALTAWLASRASRENRLRDALALALGLALFCSLVFIGALKLTLPLWPIALSRWGSV